MQPSKKLKAKKAAHGRIPSSQSNRNHDRKNLNRVVGCRSNIAGCHTHLAAKTFQTSPPQPRIPTSIRLPQRVDVPRKCCGTSLGTDGVRASLLSSNRGGTELRFRRLTTVQAFSNGEPRVQPVPGLPCALRTFSRVMWMQSSGVAHRAKAGVRPVFERWIGSGRGLSTRVIAKSSRQNCEQFCAEATMQSRLFPRRDSGLLRFARNDGCGGRRASNSPRRPGSALGLDYAARC